MKRELHNDNETLAVENGTFIIKGRASGRLDVRKRTLRSFVEGAFRTAIEGRQVEELLLHLGPFFMWRIETGALNNFDAALKEALAESDDELVLFSDRGELNTRLKVVAIY
ncbi:MAG: hypothetical protein IPG74_09970 [Flavobacteriales bacterium]|nr:hypothetical protein [Flavobacteriales bacterium]